VIGIEGVGPDRYMTTSGQGGGRVRYSPISVHALHAASAHNTLVQEAGQFRYVFGPFRYIMKSDCKKALNSICVTDSSMFDCDT